MLVISIFQYSVYKFILYWQIDSGSNYLCVGNIIGLGPLSPQDSCASSGSESRLDDASNRSLASGMKGKFQIQFYRYNIIDEQDMNKVIFLLFFFF
jgi:hypothetical protein